MTCELVNIGPSAGRQDADPLSKFARFTSLCIEQFGDMCKLPRQRLIVFALRLGVLYEFMLCRVRIERKISEESGNLEKGVDRRTREAYAWFIHGSARRRGTSFSDDLVDVLQLLLLLRQLVGQTFVLVK